MKTSEYIKHVNHVLELAILIAETTKEIVSTLAELDGEGLNNIKELTDDEFFKLIGQIQYINNAIELRPLCKEADRCTQSICSQLSSEKRINNGNIDYSGFLGGLYNG